jgi:hypothetical protein
VKKPTRHAELTIAWGDAEHTFRLGIGQLRELQEKTDCGPMELLRRFLRGTWRLDDVRETLRLGLIGGGMEPIRALSSVARYVDDRPLAESVPPAQAVISVLLFGNEEDDPTGKAMAEESSSSRTEGSPSPTSTEPGP